TAKRIFEYIAVSRINCYDIAAPHLLAQIFCSRLPILQAGLAVVGPKSCHRAEQKQSHYCVGCPPRLNTRHSLSDQQQHGRHANEQKSRAEYRFPVRDEQSQADRDKQPCHDKQECPCSVLLPLCCGTKRAPPPFSACITSRQQCQRESHPAP